MSESEVRIVLSLVDGVSPVLEQLLSDLAAITTVEIVTDPVVVAAEAAVAALAGNATSLTEAVLCAMPPSSTPFERGLAIGMTLILAIRPEVGAWIDDPRRDPVELRTMMDRAKAAYLRSRTHFRPV